MSNDEFHSLCGTQTRGKRMVKLREKHIKLFDEDVKASPYGRSSMVSKYSKYTDIILKHWKPLLKFAMLRRLRQHHLKRSSAKQKATEIAARRLCTSTSGKPVLLLYGDGANRGGFSKARGLRGPAKSLFYYCKQRRLARCVLCTEYRTSMLDIYGKPMYHAPETRDEILKKKKYLQCPQKCGSTMCPSTRLGCRCRCTAKHCDKPRELGNKCKEHYKKDPWKIRAVAFDSKGRAWDRDVSAPIVIGLLFFARAMGKQEEELGLWKRDTKVQEDQARSFEEIFGKEIFEQFGIILRKRRKK